MRQINVGLLGCGTVGTGVARILIENKKLIASRLGSVLNLRRVADIDIVKDRGINFDKNVLIKDGYQIVNDPDIDIIIEMIGGDKVAKDLILKAMNNGKHIVTANKALLAGQGNTLFKTASRSGVDLAFEASVGGCMPIVKSIRESLAGNRIKSMTGILNGTCNFILSKSTEDGSSFEEALTLAQANGFAEADPSMDIQGFDTAHKLAILSSLAYGMEINFDDIYIEGIAKVNPIDIDCARQFGYKIKLLAISKNMGDIIEARVHPTMIPFNNLLSNVNGSMNAVTITGDAVGEMALYGHGAGMMPTASAVISDTIDIARNIICGTKGRVPMLSCQMENIRNIPIMPVDDILTHYYFRFSVLDRAGVLASISGILGNYSISLKSVNQKGQSINGAVTIVMLTHLAREKDVKGALSEINALEVVTDEPVLIRIEDAEGQDIKFPERNF